jgi:hypothetical protein
MDIDEPRKEPTMATEYKALPDQIIHAGDVGCGPVTVVVKTVGGCAGGFITGHTGHAASKMSAAQMRRLAEALTKAAEAIEATGLPSYRELRDKGR